jgi:hypothetical protein
VSIKLSNNNLSGAIPEAMFPKLPRLKTLELNHNNLSGAVPSNLASLKELQFVHLQNNKLSGGLPATMMNLEVQFPPMQEIDLSYNMLTGTIPDTLFGPEKPGTFAPSVNLKVLNLRYNSLTGNIPSRITRDNIMVSMLVGGNKMSGTVDPVVGKWLSQRKYCDLSGNQWKCPLPAGVADKCQAACKPSMVTEVAPLTNAIKCNTSPKMKKVVVTNKLRPSIKFRTCSKVRDPKTGWACNHGTPFVDCEQRVNLDETAELDMNTDVKTVLPVTFTDKGAVDMVSACYWVPKANTILDDKWWTTLQSSC